MIFALRTLFFEARRYVPGIIAVGFSGMLIAMQVGLLVGLIGVVSVPIENSSADVWVMYPNTPACDLARPIPTYWMDRVWAQPEAQYVDEYVQGFSYWKTPGGATELIIVVGCNVEDGSLGPIGRLTAAQRTLLTEPNAVLLDQRDAKRVAVSRAGQEGEVSGQRVRCVGFTHGMGSISGPYVVASLQTARKLLKMRADQTTYLLAKCRDEADADALAAKLNRYPRMSARRSEDFSAQSQWHWIGKTKAGIALGFAAVLGLAVGASVTSQTLYAAVAASLRELAVLQALGIPRWRMRVFVLQLAMLVGVVGLAVAAPVTFGLAQVAQSLGTKAVLPPWLLISAAAITLAMALGSGLVALRSLRSVEPSSLLR
ncbi:MAG TPA: ABC transporter permease [Planctomycetia bacterium]|jgi:putative ABC transport system permease protein|nr:ABC transporter permease [Planctomycetia bacterium]